MGKIGVAATPNSERVYAMVEADPGGGLFRSEDSGESWTLINSDWSLRTRPWYYMHVRADPTDPDRVWVLNAPFLKSVDGGRTFSAVRVLHGDVHGLWINPENPRWMIIGNDGGASVTSNGGQSWSPQDNQPTGQFYRVTVDNEFPYRVYGAQQDRSTVRIASQLSRRGVVPNPPSVGGCEAGHLGLDPDDPRFVYAGCYLGLITEYDDNSGTVRDIAPYPEVPAAMAPSCPYRKLSSSRAAP